MEVYEDVYKDWMEECSSTVRRVCCLMEEKTTYSASGVLWGHSWKDFSSGGMMDGCVYGSKSKSRCLLQCLYLDRIFNFLAGCFEMFF